MVSVDRRTFLRGAAMAAGGVMPGAPSRASSPAQVLIGPAALSQLGEVLPDVQNAAGHGVGPAERDRLDRVGRRPAVSPPVLDSDAEPRQPR
jgi:hypothetical protein